MVRPHTVCKITHRVENHTSCGKLATNCVENYTLCQITHCVQNYTGVPFAFNMEKINQMQLHGSLSSQEAILGIAEMGAATNYPLLSIVIHCCPLLSIVVHCCYPLPLDGTVIGTCWILLCNCMFWLNHSCVLRQFFGNFNHCWRFSMFSIQSTTVSQYPAKLFSCSKILGMDGNLWKHLF